jgi:AraC family transcriptional regulator of adaptative response / DNA-3-methyladenine glycosylase II
VFFQVSESLSPALPAVLARLRALLDLDADPLAINASLSGHFNGMDGLRVPGTVDGFELAVRAILGQQVTVAAGRTFAMRLAQRYGQDVQTPWTGLSRVFPHASELAKADAQALGELGIVRQRQGAILALARACAGGELDLGPSADLAKTLRQLQELPGVGPWTAHYIAMRALRWPDAFPSGDVAVLHALGLGKGTAALLAAERIAESWRPWRSYGVVRAWHSLSQGK